MMSQILDLIESNSLLDHIGGGIGLKLATILTMLSNNSGDTVINL